MIEIQLKTTQDTEILLKKLPDEFKDALRKGFQKAIYYAEGEAKKSFGKAGNLQSRSGHLRRSIKSSVTDRYNQMVGALYSDVIYAGVHEYGATIKAKNAPYLKFTVGNRWVQVKSVTIPKRPFLEPAIKDNLAKIEDIILDTIETEVG